MNILFFQFGNFSEAYQRLSSGGVETYRDQRRSVEHAAGLAARHSVTVVALRTEPHDLRLAPGLRSIGLPEFEQSRQELTALLDDVAPDVVICRTPHLGMLRELKRRGIRTFPCLADNFSKDTLRQRLSAFRFTRAMRGPHISCVSNHSLRASQSLERVLGIPAERIVPRDWSPMQAHAEVKTGVRDPLRPAAFYAGAIIEAKGVGDVLDAIRRLEDRGISLSVTFAGAGDVDRWRARAEAQGVGDRARFVGMLPNQQVREGMRESDMVFVPSHHDYAEGLPNTLIEGLASRSPVVVSDHPVFADRLENGRDCLMFPARDAQALAACVARLCADADLYVRLSGNAQATLDKLRFGVEWTEMIDMFIADPEDRTGWVERNSLAAMTR